MGTRTRLTRALVGLGSGWWGEDCAGSDAPPDDVRLSGDSFVAVAEGRASVAVPAHLEYARVGGHALDAEPRPERAVRGGQVRHEGLGDDLAEGGLLLPREVLPVPVEARQRLERGHQPSADPSGSGWANMSSAG